MLGFEWSGEDTAGQQRKKCLACMELLFYRGKGAEQGNHVIYEQVFTRGKQRRGNEEMWSGFTILSSCEKVTVEARFN